MRRSVSLLLPLLASSCLAQDTGLLIGVRSQDRKSTTVWVGRQGVATFARVVGTGYVFWRSDGVWRVTEDDNLRTGGVSKVTIQDPKGKGTVFETEEGRPETSYFVTCVSEFGVGLMQSMTRSGSPSTSNAGGSFDRPYPYVFKNFRWAEFETPAEVGSVFGEDTAKIFHENASAAGKSSGGTFESEASPTNWIVVREPGAWKLEGEVLPRFNSGFESGRSRFYVKNLSDSRFGVQSETGPSWVRIRSEYPDAVDFTTSPDGKMTVIVTDGAVYVHESSRTSLGKRVQRVSVSAALVVSTQWLTGDNVQKVAAAVRKG